MEKNKDTLPEVPPDRYLDKYKDKRLVKYSCLVISVNVDERVKKFLEQQMDLADNFVETWNKYD